jgi:signal transduction histidine kinase
MTMSAAAPAPAITNRGLRLLLVEDSPNDVELTLSELRRQGFSVTADVVQSAEEFTQRLEANVYDLVLADYNLPQWRGMEALELIRKRSLDIPLILVTGSLGDVKAVECLKQGAADYVLKDSLVRLPSAVRAALKEKRLRDERKQAHEELARKVEELACSNRDLEQFAYVTSHDLQEPLRMVASYVQLLAERYHGKLDENADKYIQYAVEGATRMQAMIHDLLEFSRAGRQEGNWQPTDCNLTVEQAIANLGALVQESGAVVTHDTLPTLMADGSQLLHLFQNLIGNAIKFRGAEAPAIYIRAGKKKPSEWLFSVTDNGIGIASEHAEMIFIIFKRLHGRTEYPGNGIGLSICKKIIERNGGKIWVEAQAGQGSTFKFTLPASFPQEGAIPQEQAGLRA